VRLTLADVQAAERTLRPHLAPTPCRPAQCAPGLHLKLECWQPTGSFKVRGALSFLSSSGEDARRRGVVGASAGNHALGVAFAAQALGGGLRVTLFVPETAPRAKVDKLRRYPVELVRAGRDFDGALAAARERERATGAVFAEAYDHPAVAAGQGTVGLELAAQLPALGTVVVPVGGGGLISGVAAAVKVLAPGVRVVAVQPTASPALRTSLAAGRPLLAYPAGPTCADGLAGGIGETLWAHRDLLDDVVEVTEDEIEEAIGALLAEDQVVAEGSGAAAVAAVRAGRVALHGPSAAVVSGGNADASLLRRVLDRRG
jgi:threonine dehydratase